jgi:protein phosphatase
LQAACLTVRGLVREENQDACAADVKRGIFVIADGVGGEAGGAVAAQAVVSILPDSVLERVASLPKTTEEGIAEALKSAIADLGNKLREHTANEPQLRGMSSTVVLALVRGKSVYVAHAGDSRAYVLERGKLRQLTRDHSLVAVMLELGQITPEQARVHPHRSRITRCVGMEGSVVADVLRVPVKPGCRLLLCTDGLTGMISDDVIARILKQTKSCKAACRRLVDAANRAGGADNITALIVDFREKDEAGIRKAPVLGRTAKSRPPARGLPSHGESAGSGLRPLSPFSFIPSPLSFVFSPFSLTCGGFRL